MKRKYANVDTTDKAPAIRSLKVYRMIDIDPDLSYLGMYGNSATTPRLIGNSAATPIDRQERGDMQRGECRYFYPAMTGEETGNPESPEQDYQRCEDYNRGGWCMIGIQASAEVVVDGVIQDINSGGLWGIESDSDDSYLRSVAHEQLSELKSILESLGIEDMPEWDGEFTKDR